MRGPQELLERDTALVTLRAALADAERGEGRVVLVSGEAGIGKTTLVRAFTAQVAADGAVRVLRGSCDHLLTAREHGPFHDVARQARTELAAALAAGSADAVRDRLLAELSIPTTLLVIEDVHWADEATVDALAFLARRLEATPALVVLTCRDDEVLPGSPLRRLLALVRPPSGVRVEVAPLSARAVGALAGESGLGLRLHALTKGNPFFVTELLAAEDEGVPASVRDVVLERVATLPERTRALLDLLAVVPGRVDRTLLDAVHPGWAADAEPAERRGIVELTDSGPDFRHDLSRMAVAEVLPGARRLALGSAVLTALRRQEPLDEARVLHHAVLCGDAEAVAAHGPGAARRAARAGAHEQALSRYAQLRPYAGILDPDERAAVTEEHAWELYNALRFDEAVALSGEAVALRRERGDTALLARALVGLAWHRYLAADVAAATATIEEAVRAAATAGDPEVTELARSYRAFLLVLADREAEGLAELDAMGASGALASARTIYRGLATAFLGDPAGTGILERGVADAAEQGEREFVALGYTALVKAARRLGRDDDVRGYAELGAARTSGIELRAHGYTLQAHLCQLRAQQGRWDEAEEGFRELLEAAPQAGVLHRETLPHLGRLLVRRGDPEGDALLERARALAERTDILPVLVPTGLALLERAWLAGDPAAGRDRVARLLDRLDRPGVERQRGELLRYARRCGMAVETFPGCRPEHLLGLRGDWRGAAEAWGRLGDPYERALELAESGEPGPTLEALAVLDELGAGPAARLVRARLRDLGVDRVPRGPRPETRAHPAGLTARQGEVLDLLGQGLTNAEIADRLVVSVRTVDHHVSAVLQKLGVSSRRAAARLARQAADLTGPAEPALAGR
ncbi:AAA family ATPase [Pseudonocardia kujensis]|uniref:ATP-binding protein n=1 Tax=Pseudonocardia kujensis TaxID=1128675 RepID=UPI001E4CAA10|nr:AAA family ATPase [Pseudonocardia kujensis]MCE0767895.1 AAA family ATPase [Pseudonocardia kujensis]